jgi:hypothetical protein
MKKAIDGVIFDTEKAIVLARTGDNVSAYDQLSGRTTLYRTAKGSYFKCREAAAFSEGSTPEITPLSVEEAVSEFNKLSLKLLDLEEAFPDMEFREA